jgi:hypothetical protein
MPRRRRIIPPRRRFFFGCEGASEKAFAVFLQKICENLGLHIHLDAHALGGGDPLNLVCEAIGKRKQQSTRRGRYQQSLLLLDSDRFMPEDQRCRRASTLAQAEGIKLIFQHSNHEGMLLRLHDGRETRRVPAALAESELKRLWPSYDKPVAAADLGQQFGVQDFLHRTLFFG